MKIKFKGSERKGFFADVKKETDAYFTDNKISKNANAEMVGKTVLFLGLLVAIYLLILFGGFSLGGLFVLAVMLGMVQAFIGFNVSHDAIHGSYSSNSTINKILGLTFNLIGANMYVWEITHNKVHHTYTNIPGHDEDLEVAPGMIRLSPYDAYKPVMRYQHLYAFFLYCLSSLSWVVRKDYLKFFKEKIGETDNRFHPKKEYFNLFFFKALYYTLFIVVPLVVLDITWWQYLIGFLVMHFSEGLVMGLVFQLAHVVEGTDYPEPDGEGVVEEAWAVHQMQTTANFATSSFMAKFLCGGLNFQIEHHLFPNICHVHYPELSKIVRSVAKQYDIDYIENKTFIGAIKSHYKTLKQFGRAETVKA